MADVVLDANVLIGHFDQHDALHGQARALVRELRQGGHSAQLLDFLVNEAVSVLCRRAAQRRTSPPNLDTILAKILVLYGEDEIEFLHGEVKRLFRNIIEVVMKSSGALNFNDATLCMLQQEGIIGKVATFDEALGQYPGFQVWGQ